MPATNPQTLLDEARCYACYGMPLGDLMKLSLWDRIATAEGGGGGAVLPTDCLLCKLFASDLDTILGPGDPVNIWTDGSGNGNNADLGAFATANPTLELNQLSGRSAVLFDNSVDVQYLVVPAFLFTGAAERTVYVVYKQTAINVQGVAGVSGSGGVGDWFVIQSRSVPVGDPYLAGFGADLTGPPFDPNVWKMASASYDGTDALLYKDGTLVNSGAIALNTNNDWFRIGGDGTLSESLGAGAPDELFTGYIACILVYCVAHDDATRAQVEAWIREQYPDLP